MKCHEENIVEPIIAQLKRYGADVRRVGAASDWFDPDYKPLMLRDWYSSVPLGYGDAPGVMKDWDAVLFVDSWNYALPMFLWESYVAGHKPDLFGICHGSTILKNDLANSIPRAVEYERFMISAYDGLLIHDDWMRQVISHEFQISANNQHLRKTPFPYDVQMARTRPQFYRTPRRIIYAHRWSIDKGKDEFIEFVKLCDQQTGNAYEFFVTDEAAVAELAALSLLRCSIKVTGWLPQDELEMLCREGGYAWSSASSEIAAYAVHDLVSYGMTPLLKSHWAYGDWPDIFRWDDLAHALCLVDGGAVMPNAMWDRMMEPHRHNARNLALTVLGYVHDASDSAACDRVAQEISRQHLAERLGGDSGNLELEV